MNPNWDNIIRIAQESDCQHVNLTGDHAKAVERLSRFATLVIADFLERSGQYVTNDASREAAIAEAVAAEREACAAVCEQAADEVSPGYLIGDDVREAGIACCRNLASRIRARGQKVKSMTQAKADKLERLGHANAMIRIMSDHGRRFFYCASTDRVAAMEVDAGGNIYFRDDYTDKRVLTSRDGDWKRMGFSHGGTLQDLIKWVADYIRTGKPLQRWVIGPERFDSSNIWGYSEDSIKAVRAGVYALPMFESEGVV